MALLAWLEMSQNGHLGLSFNAFFFPDPRKLQRVFFEAHLQIGTERSGNSHGKERPADCDSRTHSVKNKPTDNPALRGKAIFQRVLLLQSNPSLRPKRRVIHRPTPQKLLRQLLVPKPWPDSGAACIYSQAPCD